MLLFIWDVFTAPQLSLHPLISQIWPEKLLLFSELEAWGSSQDFSVCVSCSGHTCGFLNRAVLDFAHRLSALCHVLHP